MKELVTRAKVKAMIGLLCLFCMAMPVASAYAQDFHFTITSDPRDSGKEIYGRVLESIKSEVNGPGVFHVACGDYDFDLGGCRAKVNLSFGADFPWFGVVGNHDAENTDYADMNWLRTEYTSGHNGRTPLKSIFGAKDGPDGSKETTYSWDYGNAHFIILNCYWDGTNGTNADNRNHMSNYDANHPNYDMMGDIEPNLLAWLQNDLAINNKPFIFVFVHEPPFPYNHHVGDSLDAHPTNRDNFWSLLESHNVSAVFCGHIHYYFKHRGGGGPAPDYPGHTYCYSNDPNDWRTQDPAIDSIYGSVWEVSTGNAGQIPGGLKASPDGSCDMLEANRWNGVEFIDVNVTEDYAFINVYQDVNGRGPGSYTEPTILGTQFTLADTRIPQSATVPVIYGYVLDSSGAPLADVNLSAGNGWFDLTDADGYYEVPVHYGWSGTITSTKADYTFEPNGILYSNVTADIAEQNYLATYAPDFTPPEPNPMTWTSAPEATGTTSITMIATTASDPAGVEYYFNNIIDPTHDSGWQSSQYYEDTGLQPNTMYAYRVKARDMSYTQNETGWSETGLAMTFSVGPVPVSGTVTTNISSSARTTATFSHTVAAGNDRLLAVSVMIRGNKSVSSVTYAGISLFKAISRASGASSGCAVEIWYMVAPPVGTANVVVNFATSVDPSGITAVNFTGVNQTSPVGATAGANAASGTSITTSITTTDANSLVFGAATAYGGDTDPFTPGSGITEMWDSATGTSSTYDNGIWGGRRTAATPGAYTFNATAAVSDDWAIAAIEIKAAIYAPPVQATNPNPASGAPDVNLTADLSWTPGIGAISHDVYFGTVNPPPFQVNQTATTYDTGTMATSTTYYWRIDEHNAGGIIQGTVWSFTTVPPPPGQATNPAPASGATGVGLTTDISWTAGAGAASHDVYFGTVNPPPFKVNQAGSTYDTGTMSANKTYYWRIDEKNAGGTTTGTVWNFTTTTVAPAPTFVAAGTVASSTGAITPALPSGIASGDILLLFLETSNQTISISNSNGGTWTAVTNSPQSTGTAASTTGARLTVFWSRYNGTQGAPTTSDSGDHQLGRIIAVRGAVASGNPWDVTAGGVEAVSDTSGSIPGATTTVTNTLVVAAIATALPDATGTSNFSSWTNSNLTGITERTDNTVTAGNGGGLGIATGTKATAGAYGNTTVTCASSSYKGMMSIAIKP